MSDSRDRSIREAALDGDKVASCEVLEGDGTLRRRLLSCGMSRSGTTLLTAMLDAHPDVAMSYELLPAGISSAAQSASIIGSAVMRHPRDPVRALSDSDERHLAQLVERAARAEVSTLNLMALLSGLAADGHDDLADFAGRIRLSVAIADYKAKLLGKPWSGFKLNAPSIGAFDAFMTTNLSLVEAPAYIYILRDPRDVWLSHIERRFNRAVEDVCRAWNNYLHHFLDFSRQNGSRCALVRYEDLASHPGEVLERACALVNLNYDGQMLRFYNNDSAFLASSHPNSQRLRNGLQRGRTGRWSGRISEQDQTTIAQSCGEFMRQFGYL